jgi:SH3-like domain-containing protein
VTGASTPSAPATDDGTAEVVWEVAIVRDAPRTGQVLARLQRGSRVSLGAGQDGWYRVKYGADFSSEGWLYRSSIGR